MNNPMEWRPAARFPMFEVSEYGDMRWADSGRRIRGFIDADGYIRYSIRREDGTQVAAPAHRLVLESFVGTAPSNLHQIAHNDGSRLHCNYTNLRWALCIENQRDRAAHGTAPRGENNANAKITEADVIQIRRDYRAIKARASDLTLVDLEARYGLCRATVIRIAKAESWTHVPMENFSAMEMAQ